MKAIPAILLAASVLIIACSGIENQPATPETAYFDATGGEHTYSNGLTLVVPPGALTGRVDISIRDLNPDEKNSLLSIRAMDRTDLLFAFEAEPDGLVFASSATIIIPVENLPEAIIPMITKFHLNNRSASVADVSYILDTDNGSVELKVDHFSGYSGEIIDEIHRNECAEVSTSCRCGRIEVTQIDNDYSCSVDDCQVIYSENRVKFLDCPNQPEESSIFEEVSSGCAPELSLQVAKIYLKKGEQIEISALVRLGCAAGLEGKNVAFTVTGPGTINPDNDLTDNQGLAATTLTAGNDEGKITITAQSTITWNTKRINVNGVDLVREQKTETVTASIDIYVIEKPVLDLVADENTIYTNDVAFITATITQGNSPLAGQAVSFSLTGPADLSPVSATTTGSGSATTMLSSHDTEGTATVTARSDVIVMLASGQEAIIPISATVNVVIAEESDLDGSVWRFEYIAETTTQYSPLGCDDIYVSSDCSCNGNASGATHEEKDYQRVTGEFTISRTASYAYTLVFSNVSGFYQINRPASSYSTTCPLGGGLGGPGCACEDPGHTRTDSHGEDGVNESRTFFWSNPGEDKIEAYVYADDNTISINCSEPPDQNLIDLRSWYSQSSTCSCLGWDGTKNYHTWPSWGFSDWRMEWIKLQNSSWSETDQYGNWSANYTYTLECITNCDD